MDRRGGKKHDNDRKVDGTKASDGVPTEGA